jgi:hypothetical protein
VMRCWKKVLTFNGFWQDFFGETNLLIRDFPAW